MSIDPRTTGVLPEHDNALTFAFPMFSRPMHAADLIDQISGP